MERPRLIHVHVGEVVNVNINLDTPQAHTLALPQPLKDTTSLTFLMPDGNLVPPPCRIGSRSIANNKEWRIGASEATHQPSSLSTGPIDSLGHLQEQRLSAAIGGKKKGGGRFRCRKREEAGGGRALSVG